MTCHVPESLMSLHLSFLSPLSPHPFPKSPLPPPHHTHKTQLGNLEAPVGSVAVTFMMVAGASRAVAEVGQPAVTALAQFKVRAREGAERALCVGLGRS